MSSQNSRSSIHAYITATIQDDGKLQSYRDYLLSRYSPFQKYEKHPDPHITIMPEFAIPSIEFHELTQVVSSLNLESRIIPITGIGVYPSAQYPRVILLDIDIDLNHERRKLTETITELGGMIYTDPVNPHVTLFQDTVKTGMNRFPTSVDNATVLSEEIYRQRQLLDQAPRSVTVEYVDIRYDESKSDI
jgi:2'-5' RNA ligase